MKCPTIVRHIHGRNAPFPAHTGDPYFNKESGQPLIALLDANLAGPVEPFATYIEDVTSYKIYIEKGEKCLNYSRPLLTSSNILEWQLYSDF